ncbi:MAG: Gfo/Idh/MocA family oxidoreductase [Spirochaetia bacterium]|jgi:predicted dehydrogenase
MKKINVLVIGQGFMGGIAHPHAILEANQQLRPRGLEFVMDCVAGRNADKLAVTQKIYGYNRTSTEWEKEIGRADLVVVTSPNREHAPMAIAALKAGKAVVCEKPLSSSLEHAQVMAAAAKSAGTPTMVTFCYQGAPGVLEARRLVQDGLVLGKSGYFEGASEFLQDWGRGGRTNFRFQAEQGLGGVIEDLGAHQVDLIQFVLGRKITGVSAQTRIYDGDGEDLTMIRGSDKRAKGKAVDAFEAVASFDNGCAITFRSNRTSTGHKAFFENSIHGNRGGVQWELEDQGYLKFYSHTRPDGVKVPSRERGWTHIHVSDPGADGHLNTDTVPGLINGYLQYFRWQYLHLGLQLLGQPDKAYSVPTFADACQVAAVTDAIYRSGLEDGRLVKVPKV